MHKLLSFIAMLLFLFGPGYCVIAEAHNNNAEQDASILLRLVPNIVAATQTAQRSDALIINSWSPAAGTFILPSEEFSITVNVSYELYTQSVATLEIAAYVYDAQGTALGRLAHTEQQVFRGSGDTSLSLAFTPGPDGAYISFRCFLRHDAYTLLATSHWSDDYPVLDSDAANPRDLFKWSQEWIDFNSDTPQLFSLLGNSYSYVPALAAMQDGYRAIPLLGRVGAGGELEALDPATEESEYIAAMQYSLMRFGDFDGFGFLNSAEYWRNKADSMAEAAAASDPSQANAGIYLLSSGKSLFMIGVNLLTGGTGLITQITSFLEFGDFMLGLFTDVLQDSDGGNDLSAASRLTNLASPASFADSLIFPSADMHSYASRGVSLANELIEINKAGMEMLSFITEATKLSENGLSSSIDLVLADTGVSITHHLHGAMQLKSAYHVGQAAALGFARVGVAYAVKELTDIGPYCKDMLASLQYHYNALSIAADSIAQDIDDISTIQDADELQRHLTLLTMKIDLWYKCWYETIATLHLRLEEVNNNGWYNWILSTSEVKSIGDQAEYWGDRSQQLSELVDDTAIAIDYMLSYTEDDGSGDVTCVVPDTGFTACYGEEKEIDCPEPDEPYYGQDAQYSATARQRSFTLSDSGETVVDNVTGLIWMQSELAEPLTWQEAADYCAASSHAGYADWRLPDVKELTYLVDRGEFGPTIDQIFSCSIGNFSWSSTPYAGYPGYAWAVFFDDGYTETYLEDNGRYVRCVRGAPSPTGPFQDNGDGTVADASTGLEWLQADDGQGRNWEGALSYCENLTLGNHDDWRLPDVHELVSLVDYTKHRPAIDEVFSSQSLQYWSSTPEERQYFSSGFANQAWTVSFENGFVHSTVVTGDLTYARCVRGGP